MIERGHQIKIYTKVFFTAVLAMLLIMLPQILRGNGYFIYMGDYNYQHITFNMHCFDVLRQGLGKWDMTTGLGADFVSAYSHILYNPLFLLILLLPSANAVILVLPVITSLKVGTAALTSYIYIRKYTKTDNSAFLGAMLYAFSGFQAINLVFGSFNDITAFFPLMLVFLDEYMQDRHKGAFLVCVAYAAFVNAFFFYGQVIFILIYFIIKCVTKEYRFTFKRFFGLAAESVIGVMISGVSLLPSVKSLASNSRVSDYINGISAVSYSDSSISWRILQSIFMMPDKPAITSLFEGSNTWSSISLYLPCVGVVFLSGYILKNKKRFFSLILAVSMLFALIPVLNSMYFMFNETFYARWFYMPILIMAAATAKELEDYDEKSFNFGLKVSFVSMAVLALIGCLPAKVKESGGNILTDDNSKTVLKLFKFPPDAIYFWRTIGISALLIFITYYIINKYKEKNAAVKKLLCTVIISIIVLNIVYINDVWNISSATSESYVGSEIKKPQLDDVSQQFYRIDGQAFNANLVWNIPAVDEFITFTPQSVGDFYNEFEIFRSQKAFIDQRYYPLYSLLSTKYYLSPSTGDDLNVEYSQINLIGFEKESEQPYYHVYKNKYFIPEGFMYNYSISKTQISNFTDQYEKDNPEKSDVTDNKPTEELEKMFRNMGIAQEIKYNYKEKYLQKMLVMTRAMVLSDEDAAKYQDILPAIRDEKIENLDENTYYEDCEQRAAQSCDVFKYDNSGFSAHIESDRDNLVFFSVPYDDGWSAQINGNDTEVIKANYGFMAVRVGKGSSDIRFNYTNTDFRTGLYITIAGIAGLLVYCVITAAGKKKTEHK